MSDDPSYFNGSTLASKNSSAAGLVADDREPEALPLSETHRKMLMDGSAIAADIIRERGYRTITGSAELHAIGFAQAQCRLGNGLLIPTFDVCGKPKSAQFRADRPRQNRDGRDIKYETARDSTMYLDVLPRHAEAIRNPEVRLWFTEGVKKSDSISSQGEVAIGLFGVWNWRGRGEYGGLTALPDFDEIALKGRDVIICFDNDYREKPSVLMAMHRFAAFLRRRGANVDFINLPEGPKLGVDDYLGQHHSVDDVLRLKTNTLPEIGKQSQSELLMSIAESRCELIYTQDGQCLATVGYAGGHREVLSIGERGSSMRDWLIEQYCTERKRLPSTSALTQVMEAIGAACRRHGRHVEVFTRLASHEGKIYLDLANAKWEAIEIGPDGWTIVNQPPVYFRRPTGMLPLPHPIKGGALCELADLLRIPQDSNEFMLIAAWLIGVLHPTGPYTHLNLQGEQGCGKSTATRMIRSMIDPNSSPTRRLVKDDEDLMLAALNGAIVAVENVSYLSQDVSDLLCGLSTGIGLGRRKKYTDVDETLFYAKRPAIVNGIAPVATHGDLIDRLITVVLPTIDEEARKSEKALWDAFYEKRPIILGGLLDAVVMALKRQHEIKPEKLPRMADFATWVEAAAPALGWKFGQFLNLYNEQQEDAVEVEIEASPVATALLRYLEEHGEIKATSATDILPCLLAYHTDNGANRPAKSWPTTPEGLGREFSRIAPAMRQRGYRVERAKGSRRGGRKWQVLPIEVATVPRDDHSLKPSNQGANPPASPVSDPPNEGRGPYKNRPHETRPPFPCPTCGSQDWDRAVYTWRCRGCRTEIDKPESGWSRA